MITRNGFRRADTSDLSHYSETRLAAVCRRVLAPGVAVAGVGLIASAPANAGLVINYSGPAITVQRGQPATPVSFTFTENSAQRDSSITDTAVVSAYGTITMTCPGAANPSCPAQPSSNPNSLSSGSATVNFTAAAAGPNGIPFGYTSYGIISLFDGDYASANGATAFATITYNIVPVFPTATSFTASTGDHTPLTVNLTQGHVTYDSTVSTGNLSVTITSPGSHGSAVVSGTSITYTPNGQYIGPDAIGYQFSDGYTSVSGTMTVNVTPVPVTASSFSLAASTKTPATVNVTGHTTNDPLDPSGSLHVSISSAPAHGSATVSGTSITYTSNDSSVSNDSIGYSFTDGYTTATGTITVQVSPQSLSLIQPIPLTTAFNVPSTVDLSQGGRLTHDPAEPLSSLHTTVTTNPAHGSASVSGTVVTYTPSGSYAGADTVGIQVTDGFSSASSTIKVTVSPPVLTASSFASTDAANTADAVDLSQGGHVTDSAIPIGSLQFSVASAPTHGSATVSGHIITYTPSKNFSGADTIAYSVTDGYSTAHATITVNVAQPQVPVPASIVGMKQAAAAATLQSAGFVVAISHQQSQSVAFGSVITSTPAPGVLLHPGATVTLVISQGNATNLAAPISSVAGLTNSELSVARGVENVCNTLRGATSSLTTAQQDLLTTCSAIIADNAGGQNLAQLSNTLHAISGRQLTAPQQMGVLFSSGQAANIGARLNELRNGAQGFSASGLNLGVPSELGQAATPLLSMAKSIIGGAGGDDEGSALGNRLGIFINGNFTRGSQASTDNEEGFDLRSNGVTAGIDYRITDHWIMGVAGGYSSSTSTFDDASGNMKAKSYSGTLYGTFEWQDLYVDWLASGGHNSYNSLRDISFASSSTGVGCGGGFCSTTASGSTGARQLALGMSTGYNFHVGAFTSGPDLAVNYTRIDVDAFTESGPSGLNLSYGEQSGTSVRLKAGAHANYALSTRYCVIMPDVSAQFVHEFNDNGEAVNVKFAADSFSGQGFQIFTNAPDRNFFEWNAGVVFQFPFNLSGFIQYGSIEGLQYVSAKTYSVGLRFQPGPRSR